MLVILIIQCPENDIGRSENPFRDMFSIGRIGIPVLMPDRKMIDWREIWQDVDGIRYPISAFDIIGFDNRREGLSSVQKCDLVYGNSICFYMVNLFLGYQVMAHNISSIIYS